MFGLTVQFTCKDQASAESYDKLVAETVVPAGAKQAVTALRQADDVTPEQIRGHYLARQIVYACGLCRNRPDPSCTHSRYASA